MSARARVVAVLFLVATASGAARGDDLTALDRILLEPRPASALRARLGEHARSIERTDRHEAARARLALGRSALRSGLADSAVTALERADDDGATIPGVAALADALLARGGPADLASARERIERALQGTESPFDRAALLPRLAEALERAGRPDSALVVWRGFEPGAALTSAVRRRALALGHSADAADRARAREALGRLALASRGQDAEVLRALLTGAPADAGGARLREALVERARAADAVDAAALTAFGAGAVRFAGHDGMPLAGAVRAPASPGRHRAAVVIVGPGETPGAGDSLVTLLVRAGHATLVLQPRSTGASVSGEWPGPWTAEERPEAWVDAGARDLAFAVRALARATRCDTARILVAASGASVAIAARAAAFDRRVAALVCVSPVCEAAARPPLLAEIAQRSPAVFVQITPEDRFVSELLADALFHASAVGHARLSESGSGGTRLAQWRDDAASRERLTRWLAEPLPGAPPATRRAPRR